MTPETLAQLHARAMTVPAPWSTQDFADLLATATVFFVPSSCQKYFGESARGAAPLSPPATTQSAQNLPGFALGRVVLDEAELLTMAVAPEFQRQGLGTTCLAQFEAEAARRGATTAHLEVAETNRAARALYTQAGWQQTGTRPAYYRGPNGRIDAILMQKALNAD